MVSLGRRIGPAHQALKRMTFQIRNGYCRPHVPMTLSHTTDLRPLRSLMGRMIVCALVSAGFAAAQQEGTDSRNTADSVGSPFERLEPQRLCEPSFGAPAIAVATAGGTVYFIDELTGGACSVVHTEARAWAKSKLKFADEPHETALRGIPLDVVGADIFVIARKRLLRLGSRRHDASLILEDDRLGGATVLCTTNSGDYTLIGTAQGRVLAVFGGRIVEAPSARLGEPILGMCLSPAAAWCMTVAEGPEWTVRGAQTLEVVQEPGNVLGEPFIHAMATSIDGQRLAISHGLAYQLKTFTLASNGALASIDGARKGGAICGAVAFHPTAAYVALGDDSGAVRVVSSSPGDVSHLPHSTLIAESAIGLGRVLQPLGSWQTGRQPIRGVAFDRTGTAIISVNKLGEITRRAWPSGVLHWSTHLFPGKGN